MTPEQRDRLEKAKLSLRSAQLLLREGMDDFAASRAYYAMLYLAQAFLFGERQEYSSHAAVIAKFGELFAKTGRVPTKFHRLLIDAEDLRHAGDYGQIHSVSSDQAREVVDHAAEFVELAERLIT